MSDKCRAFVAALEKEKLFEDDFFIQSTVALLKDQDLSSEEKVWAYYLMQKKIGWSFAGFVFLPAKTNYFQVFTSHVVLQMKVCKALQPYDFDPEPFLRMVSDRWGSDSLLCSNALLLATVIAPDRVRSELLRYLAPDMLERAKTPALINHALCLASVFLAEDEEVGGALERNLASFPSEEGREDIVCALGVRRSRANMRRIAEYLRSCTEETFPLVVDTAFSVFKEHLDPETLNRISGKIVAESASATVRERLTMLTTGKVFCDYSLAVEQGSFIKIWDQFNLAVYDNGYAVDEQNGFKEFFPVSAKASTGSAEGSVR